MNVFDLENVIAEEACKHAEAVASLNPYSEAEWIAIGNTRCVYSGSTSPIFGVYSFSEPHWEEREWRELDRFFSLKERPASFWITSNTPLESFERIKNTHRLVKTEKIYGMEIPSQREQIAIPLANLDRWAILFSRQENPRASEASYFSSIKLHQKDVRFYENEQEASYTFFTNGYAYIPYPSDSLRAWQIQQASEFRAKFLLERERSQFPLVLERKYYEPI